VHKTTSLACLALVALTSCSHQKPLSRDELQSKLRSAESIAAETRTFLDYVGQNRATGHYAVGHLEYLASELSHTARELREALPPAGAEGQFSDGLKRVDALTAALGHLHSHIDQPNDLDGDKDQITAIRKELQHTISSL
jgi:hypothetical protein